MNWWRGQESGLFVLSGEIRRFESAGPGGAEEISRGGKRVGESVPGPGCSLEPEVIAGLVGAGRN